MLALTGMAGIVATTPGVLRAAIRSPFRTASGWTAARPADDLTLARFAPHVGSRFTAAGGASVILEEATPRAPHPADRPGLAGESFSLVFRNDGRTALDDGTHVFAHSTLGTVRLFLVAVGTGRNGQGYQAVVDRRLNTAS